MSTSSISSRISSSTVDWCDIRTTKNGLGKVSYQEKLLLFLILGEEGEVLLIVYEALPIPYETSSRTATKVSYLPILIQGARLNIPSLKLLSLVVMKHLLHNYILTVFQKLKYFYVFF